MYNLHLVVFDHSNEYISGFLTLFASLSIISSIYVIINKNPIVSILFLICLFLLIALYLIMSGMKFIGLSYLLVYIGAVSILFLFILMLINIRVSEIQSETSTALPLGVLLIFSIYIPMYSILTINNLVQVKGEPTSAYGFLQSLFSSFKSKLINNVMSPQWDINLIEVLHITSIGNILYTNYFLFLILTSFILLLAMIGTIIITIKQYNSKFV